jgi:hypothetical protein
MMHSVHSFVIFIGEVHQEEGGSSQEWYACTISLAQLLHVITFS